MRILAVIGGMGAGGAERVMGRLVNHLSVNHEVLLLTWEAPGVAPFYKLPDSVQLVQVNRLGGRGLRRAWRIGTKIPALRRVIRSFDADVVVSFMNTTNLITIVACAGLDLGLVVSERTDPAMDSGGPGVATARRILYPRASKVVVQTQRIASYFSRAMQTRLEIIPNGIEAAEVRAAPAMPGPDGRFRIVALGRLSEEKGVDRLIEAFASIAAPHPAWDLVLLGDGPSRPALAELVARRGLTDRVRFAGATQSPHRELAASHVFAFPSRWEGFPNALGEAMAVGLPAIGYDRLSGVEDLIVDGVTGYLVGEGRVETTLAGALERLMLDANLRCRMGMEGLAHSARWRPEAVMKQWEVVLHRAAIDAGRLTVGPEGGSRYSERARAQG